jgi:hypothetical protein
MATKTNKIIATVLIVALIVALGVYIFVNLPKPNTPNGGTTIPPETSILTISYNGTHWNYTLAELEALPSMTGSGSFIKVKTLPTVNINGPFNFTGVNINVLLAQIPTLPSNYSITATGSDNYSVTYTYNQIQGNVDVYNQTGNITGSGGVTMLLAYKQDGQDITDPAVGPLRIVFVDHGTITPSNLWAKLVVSLEIIK